jgi:8-oxo-dGTP diphosphatase
MDTAALQLGTASEPARLGVAGAIALLTVSEGQLLVAAEATPDGFQLPRFQPRVSVSLDVAARERACRLVERETLYFEQLYTFTDAADGGITVTYLALLAGGGPLADGYAWLESASAVEVIAPRDRPILEYAVLRLQAKIGYTTIAFHLMPPQFTLRELQRTYETILGRSLDKRNFRRQVVSSGLVSPTAAVRREGSHRPAALYEFTAGHDPAAFLTPATAHGALGPERDNQQGAR